MTTKILQVFASVKHQKGIEEILKEYSPSDCYFEKISEKRVVFRAFVDSRKMEEVLDILESYFSGEEDYRIAVIPVEASIPHFKKSDKKEKTKKINRLSRVSREELYASISRNAEFSKIYLYLIAISSLVAALGIVYNNIIAVIGAMVIAPLLGPNIALALGTTLADSELVKKSIKSIFIGFLFAIIISFFIGMFLNVNPYSYEISSRTTVTLVDIAIALASGSAGAIAFTTGYFLTSLMGVMVAVAILPPLVVLGLLLGSGIWTEAIPAFLLLMVNFVCINLAGISTFIVLKVKPRTWWKAERAKRDSRLVMMLWTMLLLMLILLIVLMEEGFNVPF